MKTIAIVGSGFSGLAAAWNFLKEKHSVHVYDPLGVGGGASGISAGLLHPFTGPYSKLTWKGKEGIAATQELLQVASEALGENVYEQTGMLRLAINEGMEADFKQAAKQHEEICWLSKEACQEKAPGIALKSGIWIPSALTVRSQLYLKGLWLACEKLGATLQLESVTSLTRLKAYDLVIIATGASNNIPEVAQLPLSQVKGQTLELEWPQGIPPLPLPLNSQAYILMEPDKNSCLVGATFEHRFSNSEPNEAEAKLDLMPKVVEIFPALEGARIIRCRAALRSSTPDHKPLLKQLDAKTWILTGLGSKGLLYHALFTKDLVRSALK